MLDLSAFGRDIRLTLFGVASIFPEKNFSTKFSSWEFVTKSYKIAQMQICEEATQSTTDIKRTNSPLITLQFY